MNPDLIHNLENRNVWIFQSNPKYYRILEALEALDEIIFMISRYRNEIKKDDTVLLWVSGKYAGIYAIGVVADHIIERTSPEEDAQFWVDPSAAEVPKPRTSIMILKRFLGNPILKKEIIKIDELTQLAILKQPNATNFRVTDNEWRTLASLMPDRETSQPRADIKKWTEKQARGGKIYKESCGQILERYIQEHFSPDDEHTRDEIMAYFSEHYPLFKPITVQCHIEKYTTNYRSRIHYGAKHHHDLLFRIKDDWNQLRLYRPDEDPPPIYETKKPKGEKGRTVITASPVERHLLIFMHLAKFGELSADEQNRMGISDADLEPWLDALMVHRPGTKVASPLFLWATEMNPDPSVFSNKLISKMLGAPLKGLFKNPTEGLETYVWERFGNWHFKQPHANDNKWHGYIREPIADSPDGIAAEKLELFANLPPAVITELLRDSGFQMEQQKWSATASNKGKLGPLSRQLKSGIKRPLFLSQYNLPEINEQHILIRSLEFSHILKRKYVVAGLPLCTEKEWRDEITLTVEGATDRILENPIYSAIVQFEVQRMAASLSGDPSASLSVDQNGDLTLEIDDSYQMTLWSVCRELLCEIGYWPVTWSADDEAWKTAIHNALNNLETLRVLENINGKYNLTEDYKTKIKAHPGHRQNRGEKGYRFHLSKYLTKKCQ